MHKQLQHIAALATSWAGKNMFLHKPQATLMPTAAESMHVNIIQQQYCTLHNSCLVLPGLQMLLCKLLLCMLQVCTLLLCKLLLCLMLPCKLLLLLLRTLLLCTTR
jgi:hypothetical protein